MKNISVHNHLDSSSVFVHLFVYFVVRSQGWYMQVTYVPTKLFFHCPSNVGELEVVLM